MFISVLKPASSIQLLISESKGFLKKMWLKIWGGGDGICVKVTKAKKRKKICFKSKLPCKEKPAANLSRGRLEITFFNI